MSAPTAPKRLTIAISGSRTLRSADSVWPILDERAIYYLTLGYEPHLHLGDAQGVDALAIYWARERQIASHVTIYFANPHLASCFDARQNEQIIVAANWDTDGLGAGPIRNAAMLSGVSAAGVACRAPGCKGAELLWAVRNASARNRGTDNCIAQARARSVMVQSYTMNGPADGWLEEVEA